MSAVRWVWPRHAWLAVVALGLAARLGVGLYLGDSVAPLPGIADQLSYHLLATRVAEGHGFSFATDWWPDARANTPTAFWSYLYTLYLAFFYRVLGAGPLAARLVQAAVNGLALPWLAYRLGQRIFSPMAGAVAAAWVAVYGYFVYYSAALMTEMFYITGVLWLLDCALRLAEPGTRRRLAWVELGLAIGLTALLRQVVLTFVPVLVLWLGWAQAGRARNRAAALRAWAGGVLVCGLAAGAVVLPVTAYNYRQFGSPVLINTNSGFAFFWANHPIYGDRFVGILDESGPGYTELIPAELRGLSEPELDRALLQRGLGFVLDDPGRYVRLSLSRVPVYFMFWPAAESSSTSNLVRVASFGVALPCMLAGIVVWALRRGAPGTPTGPGGALLLLFAAVYSLVHLLSWALIRYRLPVDAVLLVFAGHAVATAWHWARRPRAASRQQPATS